jgi:molybdate transport system permease protein
VIPAVLLGYILARYSFWGKSVVSAFIDLPLVLPPTAIGYILLITFSNHHWFGSQLESWDISVLFTWKAVVLATSVMSFPLVVRTARVAFQNVSIRQEQISRTLGLSPWKTFWKVSLPLSYKGLIAALVLGWTRCLGEFGATVTLAGNIPGETQTLASSIFEAQQTGDTKGMGILLLVALACGFCSILLSEKLIQKTHSAFTEQ